jgi:AraC-like DNA-binding protein
MAHKSKAHYFLKQGQILYIGRGGISDLHQHHMIQLGISLGRPIKIRYSPTAIYQLYQNIIINSNVPHQVVAAGKLPIIFLWIDPESEIGHHLRHTYFNKTQAIQIAPQKLEPILPILAQTALEIETCTEAEALTKIILQVIEPSKAQLALLDPRVLQTIELLKAQHKQDDSFSLEQLAAEVYLSPSRLMHLFREQIGLPIRRYSLWQHMLNALLEMARGRSLTEAAHDAGFADSAHMTRTFRMMFGIKPSELFKNSRFVQVISCYQR